MNLDGTGQAALYGASSWFPTSLLHARQIPGTQRFLSVASGHHTWQQGKVVEIDPNLGRNEGAGMSFVAPRRQHSYERVDAAMQEREVFAYRNLACNVFAEAGAAATAFPHATASSECRSEPHFFARCAIDGYEANAGHGNFPFQSWGPERIDRPWLAVDFGRPVRLDRLDIVLRADFPHDEAWTAGEVRVDGQHVAGIRLEKTADVQSVHFAPVEGRKVEIRDLSWEKPGWCALTELRVWGLDADRTPQAIIAAKSRNGQLERVPLQ